MGLSIPEEYGGFGASAKVYNRVFGEVGLDRPGALRLLRRASVDRLQRHRAVRQRGAEAAIPAEMRARRNDRGVLPHRARLRLGRAGDEDARRCRATDGTHYVLNGTKIWISNAGYAGHLHRVRQGPRRGRGRAKGARDRVHRRRARPGRHRSASSKRRWASRRRDTRAISFDNVQSAGRGPARGGRAGVPHRARDPELRAARPRRRFGARHAQDHERRDRLRETAGAVRSADRIVRDDPAQDRHARGRVLRARRRR